MIDIKNLVNKALIEGYELDLAKAKVCQDIILWLIENSNLKNNITIKGGVLMRSISKNIRRATLDIDFDLIRYPLCLKSINNLINNLNTNNEGIIIKKIGKEKVLHHQNYRGLRIIIEIKDSLNYLYVCKMDIGVHKYLNLTQKEYCFDVDFDKKGIILLANSKEQIFTEKLKSLLIFGSTTTRYKDIFDMYYLVNKLNIVELKKCIKTLIFNSTKIKHKTYLDICFAINKVFNNNLFLNKFNLSNNNWLNVDNDIVLKGLLKFLSNL